MTQHSQNNSNHNTLDFDIYGIVGVRLLNPAPSDTDIITRQLGPLQAKLDGEPDIVIRFERNIPLPRLNYLGLDFCGFTEKDFYILKSKKAAAKVCIPFDQIGGKIEIVCESGLKRVPLLTAIINLTMINKNFVPLHAAAFEYNGTGILVTGWSKGGKTEALLSFADNGARYVGDEWVFLSADGRQMYGLTEPIHVWDWQLNYLSRIKPPVKSEKKVLFKVIRSLDGFSKAAAKRKLNGFLPLKFLGEAMPAFKRQLHVTLPPQTIFQKETLRKGATPEKLFFVMSHNRPEITVEPCNSLEIARRMVHSNRFELFPFLEYYQAFRFAFPDRRNEYLDNVHQLHGELLHRAFAGKEAYHVLHPYPVSLKDLFREMQPYCAQEAGSFVEE